MTAFTDMPTAPESDSPLIGISSYAQRARWSTWDDETILLPRRYADSVAEAGGTPVLLPPLPGIELILPRLDGLVLSGGGDIDPARYAAARETATGPASEARDSAELALCTSALSIGVPLLGICRGLQVINVALGGTLQQHLPDIVGHDGHSPDPGGYGRHDVTVAAGSQLAGALGRSELPVPTHHHQAVSQLGKGLIATAWTADGVVEATEFDCADSDHGAMLAVQWHPEAGEDLSLFRWLIAAARSRLARSAGS